MRTILLLIFLTTSLYTVKSQNLVPNGDFEQLSTCPNNASQMLYVNFWMVPSGGSPDYFNQCGTGYANIPHAGSAMNFQQTHSGAGYSGFSVFYEGVGPYREYIEITLDSTLVAGECYDFKMYFNLSNNSKYAVSTMGVYFSDTLPDFISSNANLPYTPQITNSLGNFPDSLNWTLMNASYTASGGEQVIIIGNFNDDINTDSTVVNPFATSFSYVYVDDVSLTRCLSGGMIDSDPVKPVVVYPNPSSGEFNFTGLEENSQIEVFDVTGQVMLKVNASDNFHMIDISARAKGLYFYRVTSEKKLIQQGKILLN